MKTKIKWGLLCLLLITNTSKFQAQKENSIIHPPNTYSLGKYGDIPVSYSTGVPNINIPLFTLTDKDASLDISLSYHASGIKVDEEANWVGLGWVLNAGGVITRNVNGLPDDPGNNGEWGRRRTSIPDFKPNNNESQVDYINRISTPLYAAATNQFDNGPDIFYFNFAGYSGRFFFDENINPCFAEYQDFKVQFIYNTQDSQRPYFIITDSKGIKYEFKELEITTPMFDIPFASAWYLTKMTTPSGGGFNFTYGWGGSTAFNFEKRTKDVFFLPIYSSGGSESLVNSINDMRPSKGFLSVEGVVLDKITSFSGATLKLGFGGSRQDAEINAGLMLDNLVLKDPQGTTQKKFKFNYGYFQADINHRCPSQFPNMDHLNYRLRLESLQEISSQDIAGATHRFEYFTNDNPNIDDAYSLPYRLSPAQDHWGYYNHSYNKTIYPNNPDYMDFYMDEWYLQFLPDPNVPSLKSHLVSDGGNREPDSAAVKAGTLKKITYPTGGYTLFDYEAHGYFYNENPSAGGLRIKQVTSYSGQGNPVVKTYSYGGGIYPLDVYDRNHYYTRYYQNDTEIGNGRPELLAAFDIPSDMKEQANILRVDAAPQAVLGAGPVMVYGTVTETTPGNGRTEYNFSYHSDLYSPEPYIDNVTLEGAYVSAYVSIYPKGGYPPIYSPNSIDAYTWPYPKVTSLDWKRGQLISKNVFAENGNPVTSTVNDYDLSALKAVPAYKAKSIGNPDGGEFVYARYYVVGGMNKLKKENTIFYDASGAESQQVVHEYDYTSPSHKQVTEERTWNSKGEQIKTQYFYPSEYGSLFSTLKGKNILAPIDTRTYLNNRLVSGMQMQYNDQGLPLTKYSAEPGASSDIPFNASSAFTFSPVMNFSYNSNNLIQSLIPRSEIKTVYLWSYGGQYPIVEIQGATYDDVKTALGYTSDSEVESLASLQYPSDEQVQAVGATLRTYFSGKPVLVNTYTYKPLVGMSSATDPRGVKTKYEYDTFNRLGTVRDKDGNILKHYQYKFQNQ